MSASPSGGPNGQRPTPPPGAPPLRRPRSNANPMVARKRPPPRPQLPPKPAVPSKDAGVSNKVAGKQKPVQSEKPTSRFENLRVKNGGWSTPLPAGAQEFPLYITKKELKEGSRFHVMRFAPHIRGIKQTSIDPADQEHFPRPVTLQRRDPRQPPAGREVKPEPVEQPPPNAEEAERQAQLKAQREAQRALDDAQKAPVLKDAERKRQQQKNKDERKTATQVHYQPRTEKQKKEAEIRYEEALPWHLEDADGKHVWVGQYEAPLSDQKVALIPYPQAGGYRMLPLEKWYKFAPKRGAFQHLTIEEAEKIMGKKAAPTRWAIRDSDRNKAASQREESRRLVHGPTAVKQESSTFQQASRREKMEHDDIDMSGDEFQDDDETAGFEPDRDEDTKDSKDRVRREQLGANLFGDADEKQIEKEEAEVQKEEEARKLLGKQLKKALRKRDKQFQYDSDSSGRDPFASSSSESESDSEKENEENKAEKDKNGGSTSAKGASTPQGKKTAVDAAKKGKSLKRPGSPLGSDSSGTESTRNKKKKKLVSTDSVAGSRSATPLPGGQSGRGAGSTSDGEATGGEMSDGAGRKIKRHPHLGTGAKGTPAGSRSGSPNPSKPRPISPEAGAGQPPLKPITAQEILDALPPYPNGITIGALLKMFDNRVDKEGHLTRKEWLGLVKENAVFNQSDKLLRRKP